MRRSALLFGVDNRPTSAFKAFLHDINVPGEDLASIDKALQDRFFQKDKITGQPLERWELEEVNVSCPPNQFRRHLAVCGFLLSTEPDNKVYKYAAWPGALLVRAHARLMDIVNAWNKGVRWSEIIVFGGKRPLHGEKESFIKCCDLLQPSGATYVEMKCAWDGINPDTELRLLQFLWAVTYMPPELRSTPIIFVDAPMKPPLKAGDKEERPTTEDTVNEWLKGDPALGSILLSSGAPYGMAQDEALWMLLGSRGFTIETFGHTAPDLPVENFMKEVAGCVNRIRKARLPS